MSRPSSTVRRNSPRAKSRSIPTSSSAPEAVWAIDWSGALSPAAQRRGIRAARCDAAGGEVDLLPGLLRSEVEELLIGLAGEAVVVGLDFSFSYPGWFLREEGCSSAPELWARAASHGERWLREPHGHFWGRRKGVGPPASHRGPDRLGYRRCEQGMPGRRLPSSSFQIGGAGAVGTGTLRGLPMLGRLRERGWSVWPFDPPRLPHGAMLLEIYPRALTGPVVKSSAAARAAYLTAPRYAALPDRVREEAAASEDAFDAVVSALVMREHALAFASLAQADDPVTLLEGAIWRPPPNG